jgi:general secretion pathway protein H
MLMRSIEGQPFENRILYRRSTKALPSVNDTLRSRYCSGFTLFELLVTLVIISIIVGLAVLSIGDNQAERERRLTEQVATLMELARESALFNAEEFGVSFWKHGYEFYRFDGEQWQPISDDVQLRPREFPEDISISLYLDGLKVELPVFLNTKSDKSDKSDNERQPQVFFLSSGEVTPFELRLGNGQDTEMELISDALGNFTMIRQEG